MPVGVVNTLGCVLFFWIMRDLDRDRLENEAHEARLLALQAELRTLRAQVDPHFLNNALNDLKSLIRQDPDKARYYVVQLLTFLNIPESLQASIRSVWLRNWRNCNVIWNCNVWV